MAPALLSWRCSLKARSLMPCTHTHTHTHTALSFLHQETCSPNQTRSGSKSNYQENAFCQSMPVPGEDIWVPQRLILCFLSPCTVIKLLTKAHLLNGLRGEKNARGCFPPLHCPEQFTFQPQTCIHNLAEKSPTINQICALQKAN